MGALAKAGESLGLKNVKTLLASGNVLFEAPVSKRDKLTQTIDTHLTRTLGHDILTIVRTMEELRVLVESAPFKGVRVTPQTRLFVTFLSEKSHSKLEIPYLSPDKSYRILSLSNGAVCSVLTVGPQWARNLRQMDILEKEFGKGITTRSWSTVVRVLKAGS